MKKHSGFSASRLAELPNGCSQIVKVLAGVALVVFENSESSA